MCLPALPLIAAVAAVGSTAVSVYGAQQQAGAASAAAGYQAQVARNNAIIQERNAQGAIEAGQIQEQNQRQKTAQNISSSRARMAANGLDTTSGTPVDVIGDTAKLGELDALTIRSNAGRQAYNYRVEGMSDTAQAALDDASASNARKAGTISSLTSVLSGATSLSDKFAGWQKAGILA